MNVKLFFCLLCLFLLIGCTLDKESSSTKGNHTRSQRASSEQASEQSSEPAESEVNDAELVYELDDFLGATKMVSYAGWISQSDISMSSSLSELWEYESDLQFQTFYSFEAVRVYFENGGSNFYLVELNGRTYYYSEHSQTQLDYGSESSSKTGPGIISIGGKPRGPARIGSVDYDGEVYISVNPAEVSDEYFKQIQTISTHSDGSTSSSTYSLNLMGLSAGGGSKTSCTGDSSDRSISGPQYCLTFISADGTFSGTYYDSIHNSDSEGSSTTIRKVSWDLYPLEPLDEDVPIGNEESLGDADYSEVMEEFSSHDDGFSDWIVSTY